MPIVIDHAALDMASSDLSQDGNYLQQALDKLDAEVQTLSANWEGEAQAAYLQAKRKWSDAMTNIRATLAQISTAVQNTNERFAEIDKQGAAMYNV